MDPQTRDIQIRAPQFCKGMGGGREDPLHGAGRGEAQHQKRWVPGRIQPARLTEPRQSVLGMWAPCVPRGWQEGPISEAHQGTVNRKVLRLDGLQLIQHFADDDHACPDSADTRSQTAQLGVRQSESPGNQKYIVEQRHLKIESQKWGQEFPSCLSG